MVLCAAYGCNNRTDRKQTTEHGDHKLSETPGVACHGGSTEPSASKGSEKNELDSSFAGVPEADDRETKAHQRQAHLREKLSFHKFPRSGILREKWIAAFNRDRKCITANTQLCSEHFLPESYVEEYWLKFEMGLPLPGYRNLKKDAVPSKFVKSLSAQRTVSRPHTEARLRRKHQKEEVAVMLQEEANTACSDDNLSPDCPHIDNGKVLTKDLNSKLVQTDSYKPPVSTVSVGTWAYAEAVVPRPSVETRDMGTQTIKDDPIIYNPHGSPWKVLFDHQYANSIKLSPATNQLIDDLEPMATSSDSSSHYDMKSDEMRNGSGDDPDWDPLEHEDEELADVDEEEDEEELYFNIGETPVTDNKYLVFGTQLEELLQFCPRCGAAVLERNHRIKGSLLTVEIICSQSHTVQWKSQPVINHYPVGNILLSAACLFVGSTFTRFHQMAEVLGLKIHKPGTFFRHQKEILFQVISGAWKKEKRKVLADLSDRQPGVTLIGDGRCDSPGFSAKYGTYTVMDSVTSKVVEFEVVQVSEVSSSVAMEKEGLKRVLDKIDNGIPRVHVDTVATDRHIQIARFMEKEHPDKMHQFDVWHFSKNVTSRLNLKAKTKKHAILRPWIQCISNHLWWSAATCGGNAQQLRERWTSIVFHVSNIHEWDTAKVYHKCGHPPLEDEESRNKLWLKPGSPSHKLLQEIVFDEKLLAAIDKLTMFCHTGPLEVAHSLYLKYCPKRQHFSYKGMVARTMLAALDNNHNVGRDQAVIQAGKNAGVKRYNIVFPKGRKRWVAKPVLVKKDFSYITDMMETVHRCCAGTSDEAETGEIRVPELPSNISRQEPPVKEIVISTQRSRLNDTQ